MNAEQNWLSQSPRYPGALSALLHALKASRAGVVPLERTTKPTVDDMLCMCRTTVGESQRQRHWSCGAPVYEGSPHPLPGSVHSTPRWHQRSTKAALLSRGSLSMYHAGHSRLPCAAPRPPAPRHTGGRPAWDERCHSLGCLLRCWLCLRCPVRGKQAGEHGQAQSLLQPLEGLAGRPCPAIVRQKQVCAVGGRASPP